jgi:hypothetical protein
MDHRQQAPPVSASGLEPEREQLVQRDHPTAEPASARELVLERARGPEQPARTDRQPEDSASGPVLEPGRKDHQEWPEREPAASALQPDQQASERVQQAPEPVRPVPVRGQGLERVLWEWEPVPPGRVPSAQVPSARAPVPRVRAQEQVWVPVPASAQALVRGQVPQAPGPAQVSVRERGEQVSARGPERVPWEREPVLLPVRGPVQVPPARPASDSHGLPGLDSGWSNPACLRPAATSCRRGLLERCRSAAGTRSSTAPGSTAAHATGKPGRYSGRRSI